MANQIIIDAYKAGASDIHVEPYSDKRETLIRFRVDGDCYEYQKVPASYRRALSSRFKIMSRLDISERRKPQAHATVPEIHKVAVDEGMTTLVQDGVMKSIQGLTDYKQVKAVAMK